MLAAQSCMAKVSLSTLEAHFNLLFPSVIIAPVEVY